MSNNRYIVILYVFILFVLFSFVVFADMIERGIKSGSGNGYTGLDGIDAFYSNPALLSLNDYSFLLELDLTGELWNNLFMNDIINESKKDNILRTAKSNGLLFAIDGNFGGKMAIPPLTFFADSKVESLFQVSDDFTELLLRGNEIEREYFLDGTNGAVAFYTDSGINYSFKMGNKYFGITYHYLKGGFAKYQGEGSFEFVFDERGAPYLRGNDGNIVVYCVNEDFNSTAVGHALDLGFFVDYDDRFGWGFSVLNIGASLKAENYKEYEYNFEYDEINNEWNVTEPDGILYREGMTMKLPLVIKLGGKIKCSDNIDTFVNYIFINYKDSIYLNRPGDHRIVAAVEYTGLDFLPLRTGVNYSSLENDYSISVGLGLYLGPVRMDIGFSDLTGFFYRSKGVAGGLSFGLKF